MKSFPLWRFLPPFVRDRGGQHIGETITDHRGQVAYLKTFRLSDPQIRRGHLLRTLAGAGWELDRAAAALGSTGRSWSAGCGRPGSRPCSRAVSEDLPEAPGQRVSGPDAGLP
ncbi:hypothetical protein ASD97_02090 [Streptomyces sp. Root63]|nr:hypothetical protein ASD29_24040 [Streptomyces sp. Root1295]KRA49295.1 hypothetical protein ASD97_02090 [Streptomyces sp. Root63]